MPHTAAQAEASRRNGARGQGPTTPEGKARAAQNARSHGLRSARLCLSSQDDRAAFELTHAALAARFAPVDAAEAMLVARMATALHRAERADLLEAHFWDHRPYGVEHNAPQRMAKVLCTRSDGPRNLATIQRYQVEAGNAFTRALKLWTCSASTSRRPTRRPTRTGRTSSTRTNPSTGKPLCRSTRTNPRKPRRTCDRRPPNRRWPTRASSRNSARSSFSARSWPPWTVARPCHACRTAGGAPNRTEPSPSTTFENRVADGAERPARRSLGQFSEFIGVIHIDLTYPTPRTTSGDPSEPGKIAVMWRTLLAPLVLLGWAAVAHAAEPLVGPDWLHDHLGDPDLVVLDVRDSETGSSDELFASGHIPGAVHADYATAGWRTRVDGVAGMLPPVADVERLIGGLGIGNTTHVVIVPHGLTSSDFGAATRVYWTFDVMGDDNVSILNGGYAGWQAAGLPVETGAGHTLAAVPFTARFRPELIATADDVANAGTTGTKLIDARPTAQYRGQEVPANVGVAGTIPGALSLPNDRLVGPGGAIGEPDLDRLLAQLDLHPTDAKITFCNTGHWASVDWFLLAKVGGDRTVRLYDGSMADWAKAGGRDTELGADRLVD